MVIRTRHDMKIREDISKALTLTVIDYHHQPTIRLSKSEREKERKKERKDGKEKENCTAAPPLPPLQYQPCFSCFFSSSGPCSIRSFFLDAI